MKKSNFKEFLHLQKREEEKNKLLHTISQDINEREQAQKDLRESEIQYRRLFEAAKDGILILDADSGAITDANPFIMEILGYSPQDLIGKRLWEIGAFFDVVASKAAFEELQRKEYIRYENLPLQTKDGQMREVEFISNVYLVDLKKVIQCNIRNITKRKEAIKALEESEIRYRRLFESAKDGILILDAETGKIIDANLFFLKILNYSREEVIGKQLWEIGPFKDIFTNQDSFRKLQYQEYIRYEHLLLYNKDGAAIHVEFVSNFYFINEHKVIQCNIRDITERKRAEQEIELLARFPSENPHPVLRVEHDGKINYANPASEALLRLWNCTVGEYLPLEWRERVVNTVRHGTSMTVDVKCEERLYSIMAVPIPYAGYINLYGSDITERTHAEEQLRQMQKMEGLGTLAGGIAHDFNNILGIILAYITSTKRFKDDAKKLDLAVNTIVKAVERGKTLVQQILTFARKTETEFGAVDVNDVIMEVMTMIFETFPKNISYGQNFDKAVPCINADRSQLHQTLLNLCVNARDAMPNGGVLTITTCMVSSISLRLQHPDAIANRYACIEVSDTGEGMTEEIRKHIFEPFFTTKDKGKGTGLGLAVVFGIVRAHKGFIDVESELGKGTTFRIYLPESQVIEPINEKVEETLEEMPGGTETLLIVEDEEMLKMPLQIVLVEKGYKVISASDGLEAVDIYEKRKKEIALVLTDLGLPKMNGMDVCAQIKKINPKSRVIVATGYLDPEMKSKFLEAGIQHFLFKPYDLKKVLKVLREVIDGK
jgi:PAS domain S-box-containing protein